MQNPSGNGLEIEVKFQVADQVAFLKRLADLGAVCTQEKVLENNLRFDTPEGRLRAAQQVLRLRKDNRVRLTYKGPAEESQTVAVRPEIEFTVSDFESARSFLEALGYVISVVYEKYRTSFELDGAEITLDEMPFGLFCEIEGRDASQIENLASRLGFEWDKRITDSYLLLFETLKKSRGLTMRDLTFEAFNGISINPQDLFLCKSPP
jgi:adenylate cyclase class 2